MRDGMTIEGTLQSEMIQENSSSASTNQQEVTNFVADEDDGEIVDFSIRKNFLMSGNDTNAALADFLKRPILIHTQTWTEGTALDPATHNFLPWHLWLSTTSAKNKLQNYMFLRGDLHLKVIINASPFYYGMAMLSYAPLNGFESPIVGASGSTAYNVGYSQRPHIKILPQNNTGGELICPFFYYKEWLDITSSADVQNMGKCRFTSFGDLLNANSVSGSDVNMSVFAWMDNLQLAGPTATGVLQAKDEYEEDGPVSKHASAIARAAGMLSNVPVLGSFFTATSLVGSKVAGVARVFGFTNVPVIEDVHSFKNQPLPQLASADIGTSIEKLTLDAKNELTVDPKVMGIDVDDELNVANFCGRESFLSDCTWDATDASGTNIMWLRVNPTLSRIVSGTGEKLVYDTPMGHASRLFKYWRGDITFRFMILCSQYHRGRLNIFWDPQGAHSATMGEVYNEIIDIGECQDISITVPYMQATAFLSLGESFDENEDWSNTSAITGDSKSNGLLVVQVQTVQSSPIASAPIKVLVFVKGEPNFELGGPTSLTPIISPYQVQSLTETGPRKVTFGGMSSTADDRINLLYQGESIKSFRTLYRRSTLNGMLSHTITHSASDELNSLEFIVPRRPRYPGFDLNGFDSATGVVSAITENYNWVSWAPMTWFDQCFIGSRGSVNWQIEPVSKELYPVIMASRNCVSTLSNAAYDGSEVTGTTSDTCRRAIFKNRTIHGLSGMAASRQDDMSSVAVVAPMYSQYKILETAPAKRNTGYTSTDSDHDGLNITLNHQPINTGDTNIAHVYMWVSAGADYSPVFFLNVPTLYLYNSIPAAP